MLGRRVKAAIFFVLPFLFAACGGNVGALTSAERLHHLESEGILSMTYAMDVDAAQDFRLYTAHIKDIMDVAETNARVSFPVFEELAFERTDGDFNEMLVTGGQRVQAGDVLATLDFDTEALQISYNHALFQLNMFEEVFREQNTYFQTTIATMRERANYAAEQDWEQYAIELARLEFSHAKFLFDSDIYRQRYAESVQEIRDVFASGVIVAPFDGVVTNVRSILQGNSVRGRVMTIVDTSYIRFVTSSASPHLFRFGNILTASATIDTEYGPETIYIDLRVVQDIFVTGSVAGRANFILAPLDIDYLRDTLHQFDRTFVDLYGITFTVNSSTQFATQAIVVSRRALGLDAWERDNFVLLYENGNISRRYVAVGGVYGSEVQILSGLDAGQKVVLF